MGIKARFETKHEKLPAACPNAAAHFPSRHSDVSITARFVVRRFIAE
jgi:hypothetical protein